MPMNPSGKSRPPASGVSRRQFVRRSGAALAAGLALPSLSEAADEPELKASGPPSTRPNIVLLITDQERFPQFWPEGWADANLPNRRRLARHGLTFTRAFCNTAMCSPSRATLFTGLYPEEHGVKETLETGPVQTGTESFLKQSTLQPRTWNLAHMLASAGYDVQYRGKWHISKDSSGTLDIQTRHDLERYGFHGWLPPDGGQDAKPAHFGGGDADFDAQYAAQAAEFLRHADPESPRPFALVVALINPHDLMAYPRLWAQKSYSDIHPYYRSDNYGRFAPECFDQGISLPPTFDEDTRYKPTAQAESTVFWSRPDKLGPLETGQDRLDYVNFYAFLHRESDRHLGTVLDALESNPALNDKTIVIRTADHGEMGLSHGGMRQKAYNAYEETIHVPLVVSNPKLFPHPVRTKALASLVDLMPTIATLAGVTAPQVRKLRGRDLTPVLRDAIDHPDDPRVSVQDSILFTGDEILGSADVNKVPDPGSVKEPSHLRCLREERWKFVLYFDPDGNAGEQCELYDLREDPAEERNLAHPSSPYHDARMTAKMRAKLDRRMIETGTYPW